MQFYPLNDLFTHLVKLEVQKYLPSFSYWSPYTSIELNFIINLISLATSLTNHNSGRNLYSSEHFVHIN